MMLQVSLIRPWMHDVHVLIATFDIWNTLYSTMTILLMEAFEHK